MSGQITYSNVQNFKKINSNLNKNMQITIHVRSLPWHSGKVLESIDSKSSRVVSSKPTWNVSNFTNRGKKCDRTLFTPTKALYPSLILCTTSISYPTLAATCDPRYLKQSTSSNGSSFSITCIRSPLPYLEHLITLLLPTFTLNFHNFTKLAQAQKKVNKQIANIKSRIKFNNMCISKVLTQIIYIYIYIY